MNNKSYLIKILPTYYCYTKSVLSKVRVYISSLKTAFLLKTNTVKIIIIFTFSFTVSHKSGSIDPIVWYP